MIINMTSPSDSTMMWDIQDTAIIDKELLYTLPITLNGIKVINLNNEIHVIGYTTSDSKNHHYKRNGETWEEIDIYTQTGGYVRFYENRSSSDICVYKNKIYATCYGFSNTTDAIYIYNPSTNKWTYKYTNSSSSGSIRRLYLVIAGGQLYCVHQLSTTYLYVSSVADDGTLTRLYSSSSGDVSNVYGAWEQDNLIYISCAKDTSNLIKVFEPSTKTITRNINIKDSLGNYRYIREGDIIHFKNSTYDRFYLKNNSVYSQAKLLDVVANEIIYTIIENDNYLATPTDIYTYKLYNKLMTSYAPKGTKIYLSHETHKGVSSNLKAIEGGYLVTETGKVEIGIYDY